MIMNGSQFTERERKTEKERERGRNQEGWGVPNFKSILKEQVMMCANERYEFFRNVHEVDYKASQNITKTRQQIYVKNQYSLWQKKKKKASCTQWLVTFPWNVPFYNPKERVAPFLSYIVLTEIPKAGIYDTFLNLGKKEQWMRTT